MIVPAEDEPPATPFTCHCTAAVLFVTVAVNVWEVPAFIEVGPATVIAGVLGGETTGEPPVDVFDAAFCLPPPQPEKAVTRAKTPKATNKEWIVFRRTYHPGAGSRTYVKLYTKVQTRCADRQIGAAKHLLRANKSDTDGRQCHAAGAYGR